jgi:hypothetical protein
VARGLLKRKMGIKVALFGHKIPKQDLNAVKKIYAKVESRPQRYELNLYVSGEDEDAETPVGVGSSSTGPEASA